MHESRLEQYALLEYLVTVYYISVQVLSECVSESEVGQSESLPLLQQLLNCVIVITTAAGDTCHLHSAALFSVLLRIASSRHAPTLKSQVAQSPYLLFTYTLPTCTYVVCGLYIYIL